MELGLAGVCSRITRPASKNRCAGHVVGAAPAAEEFVQHHAQRVDVTAQVDVVPIPLALLRAHVLQRADQVAGARCGRW